MELTGSVVLLASVVACSPSDSESEKSSSIDSDRVEVNQVLVESVDIADFLKSHEKLYSQFNEELIIRHFFNDEREGVFLDAGCAYPIKLSTTYYLEKHLGWSGISIDAFDYYRAAWTKERSETTFLVYAVGDKDGETITFHIAGEPSLSSVSEEQAEKWGGPESVAVRVPTVTLTKVLDDRKIEKIDFLSIDIEGAEPSALAGFDIERFMPRLVCIEAHTNAGENEDEILGYFNEHGYELIEEYIPHDRANWYFKPKGRL